MNILTNLIASLLVAVWMVTLAVFSIQNITPVSLKFLLFESIQFPLGVLLSGCAAGGIIAGAIAPLLVARPRKSNRRRYSARNDDLEEFDF
ncbi:lipopolysaccharide assembly protein LapA domain-containing protein [Gloeothece verrucosa]|uniref:Lipopolysaccharide assembly protein A domain-containing protein n=1 Tax=Gloeothece verrucosa (strain PCC 7822) TaxID=497965 RepID=E0UIA2_GLOV7|nr:lipopolysaccharide assembly protein LapA domain-containing protein [Gloeothece verrucosa]ADN16870.1 conserved hypothetical protein [Gloeothece verrucosa PCC 7822]